MKQNIAALRLTPEKLALIDAKITALEQEMASILLDLRPDEIHGLTKMGDRSEAFCRQTISIMALNPAIVPPNFQDEFAEAVADLADLDALRPRIQRLQQLREKCSDTEIAITSDIMVAALDGYAVVKVAGLGAGLDAARKEMGARFARKGKPATPTGTTPPPNP